MNTTLYQIKNCDEEGVSTYGVYDDLEAAKNVARVMHSDNSRFFSRIYVECIPLNTRLNYTKGDPENDTDSGYLEIDYTIWTITDDR